MIMRSVRLVTIVASSATAIVLLSAASGGSELAVPVMLVATLVLGGIGYGVTKNKADAAHARLDQMEVKMDKRFELLDEKLEDISDTLTELRILVARLAPKDASGDSR
ncbi:MAG: hypothetical protein C0503_02850 [Gemmatimonas sp.]|nr:hypothetical protein [Gemmatimonas sp.]